MNVYSPSIVHTNYTHNDRVGRLGELLTCYYLEVLGVKCEHVRAHGCDLWCETADGTLLRCEVKSTTKLVSTYETHRKNKSVYKFYLQDIQKQQADFHAFVALDKSLVLFYPNEDLPKCLTKSIGHTKFTNEAIEASLSYTLQRLTERVA